MYTQEDVITFVEEENVKFIKLAFFDVFGVQKNISILPRELPRAFAEGISFDASAIAGFGDEGKSDLFLHPDPTTLCILPWRPMDGRVIRLTCDVRHPDGTQFQADSRWLLKQAVAEAGRAGIEVDFGAEVEFYLFQREEADPALRIPFDQAGYMDVPPKDRGEDIRREICFTLIEMGIQPEASHHEEGPGQNEIDFRYSDALTAADQTTTFKWVVEMVAAGNGLEADFTPKPLPKEAGNGMHINLSLRTDATLQSAFLAGILAERLSGRYPGAHSRDDAVPQPARRQLPASGRKESAPLHQLVAREPFDLDPHPGRQRGTLPHRTALTGPDGQSVSVLCTADPIPPEAISPARCRHSRLTVRRPGSAPQAVNSSHSMYQKRISMPIVSHHLS